jgi:hypothetical protein
MPLVTDETRVDWEEYALANRYQVEKALQADAKQREVQDDAFGFTNTTSTRMLQQPTSIDDGTGYHPRTFSNGFGSPPGDEAEESGPYLPFWQSR